MTQFVLAAVLGVLFAAGTFLVLRRDVVRVVWGVTIIAQSANVYLVTMGGLEGAAPILAGHGGDDVVRTDPLVQALVLTAIVIGFGTTAFALVLTYRVYEEHGTIDVVEIAGAGGGEPGGPSGSGDVESGAAGVEDAGSGPAGSGDVDPGGTAGTGDAVPDGGDGASGGDVDG